LDVVRATYGIDGHAADVTSTVGAMVAKQRKSLFSLSLFVNYIYLFFGM